MPKNALQIMAERYGKSPEIIEEYKKEKQKFQNELEKRKKNAQKNRNESL